MQWSSTSTITRLPSAEKFSHVTPNSFRVSTSPVIALRGWDNDHEQCWLYFFRLFLPVQWWLRRWSIGWFTWFCFFMVPFTCPYYVDSWHSHHDQCWFYFLHLFSASSMITAAMVSWLLRFFLRLFVPILFLCALKPLCFFGDNWGNGQLFGSIFPSLCIDSTLCTECSGATNGTYCSLELPLSYEI